MHTLLHHLCNHRVIQIKEFTPVGEFMRQVRIQRFCWIRGFYGAGKTTLALSIANELIQAKRCRFVALNVPLNVDIEPVITTNSKDVTSLHNAVLIMDEAGQYLDWGADQKTLKKWFQFLRKRNQVVLMPSVIPPIKYASQFTAQRLFNGPSMGVPVWVYRWELNVYSIKDKGLYWWWNPQSIFGLVDTDYEPNEEWFIYDFGNEVSGSSEESGEPVAESDGVRAYAVTDWPGGGSNSGS